MNKLLPYLLTVLAATCLTGVQARNESRPETVPVDTVVLVDRVQVTAIKQGMSLRRQPITATVLGSRTMARWGVDALKKASELVPNFYIPDYGSRMTSSLYVRGLGARIDQPVMGMNVDNVPLMNKNNYDFDLVDVERIEVLRGPQSTLYGRNTMGGVVNIYTFSPLAYQGTRLGMEYGSGNTFRLRASSYNKLRQGLGLAAAVWYGQSDGFYRNDLTGSLCDWEKQGGARFKVAWRGRGGLRIENTASFTQLTQGGYPYASAATGRIAYNDPCAYDRTYLSEGLTLRYDNESFALSSITSYQYTDDDMRLDQDFLPVSYFTLRQAIREHAVTQDLVIRSHARNERRYGWLFGAFGFYKHGRMEAPVLFKRDGIEELILKNANAHNGAYTYSWTDDTLPLQSRFRLPVAGAALYHESTLRAGRWHFTLGLRADYEYTRLRYESTAHPRYRAVKRDDGQVFDKEYDIALEGRLRQSFTELLPKVAVRLQLNAGSDLFASAAKGYKAGGFNTQMFSDILQQRMMKAIGGFGAEYDIARVMTYKPEKSWNYEVGGHFTLAQGALRGDFALFWIDCRDQQLTVFPDGTTTGRMMTNAGRTRSLGGEFSVQASPWRTLDLTLSYGYTHATFRRYDDGRQDFRGKRIPYAPEHTAAARLAWTLPTRVGWLGDVVFSVGARGAGRIWWNEENTLTQPFYVLLDASVRLEHAHYAIDIWSRNLSGAHYDTFHFVSVGNAFFQRGKPRTFGITLHINLQTDKT